MKKKNQNEILKKAKEIASPEQRLKFIMEQFHVKTPIRDAAKYYSLEQEAPHSFGYKTNWFAIKSENRQSIIKSLNTKDKPVYKTNWKLGIEGAYDYFVFVSPVVEGWTLVVSSSIKELSENELKEELIQMSLDFGEVQIFGSHRVSAFGQFGKFIDGKPIRLFMFADGEVFEDTGDFTAIEQKILNENLNKEDSKIHHAYILWDENNITKIAANWSIDPTALDLLDNKELGDIF